MTISVRFRLNNNHTCLFHCINTCWVPWTMFEHLCSNSFLRTRQMLMHEKTCVIPIIAPCLLGNFSYLCCLLIIFSKSAFSKNTTRALTVWIRTSGLIWVQTVCKSFQQRTLGDKELSSVHVLQYGHRPRAL